MFFDVLFSIEVRFKCNKWHYSKEHCLVWLFQLVLLIYQFKLLNACIAISASCFGFHTDDDP